MAKKTKKENENLSKWASKKEVVHTSFPIYLALGLIKYSPRFFLNFIIKCSSFFFYLFNKTSRNESIRYQEQLKQHNPDCIKRISAYKQIEAFAITFVEKLECWVKKSIPFKIDYSKAKDIDELISYVDSGKGAVLLCSHLGNSEIFRNLANKNKINLRKEVPVSVLMDLGTSSNFTNTIKKVNPKFADNIVDVNNINPGTIEKLMTTIEEGGLVICAADRVSKYNENITVDGSFLGKTAPFPYGVYLITMLLRAPVYYIYGLRKKDNGFDRKYDFLVTKSSVNTDCKRSERETNIRQMCLEYIQELEKNCMEHPYQWYNFFDFWAKSEKA